KSTVLQMSSEQHNDDDIVYQADGSQQQRTDGAAESQGGNGGGGQATTNPTPPAAAAAAAPPQAPPPPQQQQQIPADVFGMLAEAIPRVMEGVVGSILNGPRLGGEQPAAGAAVGGGAQPGMQQPFAGIGRLVDVMSRYQRMWEENEGNPDERRRMMDDMRAQNDPLVNIFGQVEEARHAFMDAANRPRQQPAAAAAGAAPAADPNNFGARLAETMAELAGGGGGRGGAAAGNEQSFMDRLAAAAAAANGGDAARPGTSNQPFHHPFMADQGRREGLDNGGARPAHVLDLGGARIEILGGIPAGLDQIFRQLREGFDPGESSGSRIPDEHLSRLPNSSVLQKHVDDGRQCFICMDQFTQVGDRVAEMTCGHIFHTDCIIPWLKRNKTCPVCRAEVNSRDWIFDELELD
ncbi:hypothetical protein PFISCL1PPCAC_20252, partial [Pristionchus fissidentatus]